MTAHCPPRNRDTVPLRRHAPAPYNCFMQIWQAERAASQSGASPNRGRSKFRGMEFGAKKTVLPQLLSLVWRERSPEEDGQRPHTGTDPSSQPVTISCESGTVPRSQRQPEPRSVGQSVGCLKENIVYILRRHFPVTGKAGFLNSCCFYFFQRTKDNINQSAECINELSKKTHTYKLCISDFNGSF